MSQENWEAKGENKQCDLEVRKIKIYADLNTNFISRRSSWVVASH